MPSPLSPEEIERLAHKRAAAKMGWYAHACVYVVVNAFLFLSGSLGFHTRHWNLYPALGWGLGLTLHFISVFLMGKGSSFREQLVQRERDRLERQRHRP